MSRRVIFWSIAACAAIAAAWQAWELRWTCDDAYISFRYAQHFAEGHGLVFNLDPNEAPVEGYTNFAWTMWLALGWWLGFSWQALETWSIVWGVACHAGVVLLLARIAWRASGGRALVPIAACGYTAIHHAASLAPAGLETALFVLLATWIATAASRVRCAREASLAGFVGVLCAMTRPDGALFAAVLGLFVLHDAWRRRAPRLFGAYAAPFLFALVPYLLWRRTYYGFWVPNTFYAKSASDPYPSQGWDYVVGFSGCYWALLPALALPIWFLLRRPDPLAPVSPFLGRRPWLAIAAFVLPYIGFVIWVGGDFMFGRFLLPVLPTLLLGWDFACQRWRPVWLQPLFAAALVVGLTLRVEPPGLAEYTRPVSDNRRFSMSEIPGIPGLPATEAFRLAGDALGDLFEGLDVRIGIGGGQANLAFRANVTVAVECASGLTDAYIAHLPIAARSKPGHERDYTKYPGYLESRGVHFMFELSYGAADPWRAVSFPCPLPVGRVPARLAVYDRELMRELRRREPGFEAIDFEQFLDEYLAGIDGKTKDEVRADYARFRAAWFDHNDDAQRAAAFERFLQRGG
jgi:hypothetical protein